MKRLERWGRYVDWTVNVNPATRCSSERLMVLHRCQWLPRSASPWKILMIIDPPWSFLLQTASLSSSSPRAGTCPTEHWSPVWTRQTRTRVPTRSWTMRWSTATRVESSRLIGIPGLWRWPPRKDWIVRGPSTAWWCRPATMERRHWGLSPTSRSGSTLPTWLHQQVSRIFLTITLTIILYWCRSDDSSKDEHYQVQN